MITYVDTSTLLKLVVAEPGSDRAVQIWEAADSVASIALVVVEARAALAAAHRNGRLTASEFRRAKGGLAELLADLHLIAVSDEMLEQAAELAEREALRGYDAVHLSAALYIEATVLTSADLALCEAALHQGLHTANPLAD